MEYIHGDLSFIVLCYLNPPKKKKNTPTEISGVFAHLMESVME